VRVIETHISRVLLTGEFVYKIKKPVDLGFLDFSTLALRRQYCEDELRLNRRLAPTIYLAVVAIAGDPARPRIDPDADVADAIEYAVQMREFPQHALLDRIAARDALTPQIADAIADSIADFHQRIAIATDLAGSRSTVWTPRRRAYSTSRPSKLSTSTRGSPSTASVMKAIRSATVKSGFFCGLLATETMSRSNRLRPRWMMATWPLVSGAKLPG